MTMKTLKLLSIIFIVIVFTSCTKPRPEEFAIEFYNSIIDNDILKAKKYCLPSAIEEIERLEKINVFSNNINKEPIELMEIIIKNPDFEEGDTAIVNFKLNHTKSFLTMIFKEKKWMVAYSDNIKHIILLEYPSTKLWDHISESGEVFKSNFKDIFMKISNLAIIDHKSGVPYSSEENMIYARNKKNDDYHKEFFKIFGKDVNYNNNLKFIDNFQNRIKIKYELDFCPEDVAQIKIADSKETYWPYSYSVSNMHYDIKSIIGFTGQFKYYGYYDLGNYWYLKFSGCKLIDNKN